ncbi:hypothetical protein BKP37_08800 [Anaerobacillus alkalilacustris]|uniref:Transposase n=1 Tax=Anaerobacillus alkalilacustris TaxID=393763 RepID=A0A1S2LSA6_9BACI|nr:helix-turn-helix domain-containing protein [Anaerobacillus alkalilacustris]OIJ14265.1 hypothetical protein BKP37_08800 [Anaerobacillus alkalilacustris]
MVLSRTTEGKILDLTLSGYSQRAIANQVNTCLATVNHRVKLFKETGSTKLYPCKRKSKYEPIEEMTRQRIRYYLALETKKKSFTIEQLQLLLNEDGFPVSKSKAQKWIHLERNRLKESYLDIFHEPGQMVQFDWGTKRLKINGFYRTVCFAVFALPFSNHRFIHVTEKMNGRAFVDAFIAFTKHIGCIWQVKNV